MKNRKSIILGLAMSAAMSAVMGVSAEGDKVSVVTTIFPEYDWVKEIVGDTDDVEITMLLDKGTDLHSYQPTADDMVKIANADVFIYVGGESDEWVDDALANAVNPDMKVINLLESLGDAVKEEEVVEGMQEEDDHEHGQEEEAEYDEHVWLSLKNAEVLCKVISEELAQADPDNAETYSSNTERYLEKLSALDAEYTDAVASANKKTVLFGDRFPFRYLVDDYGLDYYAAFVGCSAETEASFETVAFLADKLNELELGTVLTIEGTDHRIADTIISTADADDTQVLSMNSLQSTTGKDVEAGASYLDAMQKNLEVLKTALE